MNLRWIEWVGSYVIDVLGDRRNVKVVCLGDWWDMAGLSLYDKGKKEMEGRRVVEDICVGNDAFAVLDSLIPKGFERHFLFGNHENRITRAVEADAQLEGLLSLDLLDTKDWMRHEFLEPVWLDGICYSHYLYNWNSGRPYAGQNLETRVRQVGHSFTMGHQQGLKWARVDTVHGPHIGLVCGSAYTHDEEYRGPQAQDHWRGIVVCNDVRDGQYDPTFISNRYLCRRYEGVELEEYLGG